MSYHNCDIDDPLSAGPVAAPRSSARRNHKDVSFITTGMDCISTVFGIFLMVGTCLCHPRIVRCPINQLCFSDFHTTCDIGTCSIHFSQDVDLLSELQLWTLYGLLNPMLLLRQDRNSGDLVDGL